MGRNIEGIFFIPVDAGRRVRRVASPVLTLRTDVQFLQMPAKNISGRLSSRASHTDGRAPLGSASFSEAREGHDAQAFAPRPALPVLRGGVADVARPGVRSMRRSSLKSTGLPFDSSLAARFLGAFH
jgi:hypothetical protein